MRLTVVVPTRDRPEHLAACLAALRPELTGDDVLLVVDSCSQAPVAGALRVPRPGASLARNTGWRAAGTEWVAFVDDDVQVAPGWRAAAEAPVAVTPDVPEQLLDAGSALRGVSANLLVRRAALEDVGGFDERLGPGTWSRAGEDLELLDRLLLAGHPGRYAPSVLAFHDQWRDRRSLLRLDYGYGIGAGARAVRRGGRPGRALAREALWENGLQPLGGDLRKGYQYGVATALVRTAGTVVGLVGGWVRRP
jgi:glycosyltransferase involved in cell wall biosynthesis